MGVDDELIRMREQLARIEAQCLGLARFGSSSSGNPIRVGITFAQTTYPTTARAVYALHPCDVGGEEKEGRDVTTSPGSAIVFALNIGNGIPAIGQPVEYFAIGARLVFQYG